MSAELFTWVLLVSASSWDPLRGFVLPFEEMRNGRTQDRRKGGRRVCADIGTKLP